MKKILIGVFWVCGMVSSLVYAQDFGALKKGVIAQDYITTSNSKNEKLEYAYYIPKEWSAETKRPAIVLVPGLNGRGEQMMTQDWKNLAEERRVLLIAPSFKHDGEEAFRRKESYHYPEAWSGRALDDILANVRAKGLNFSKLYMVGMSAGAQFVGRYSLAYPQNIVKCAIIASGGDFVVRPNNIEYFYGIGSNEQDNRKTFAKQFYDEATNYRMSVQFKEYPGVGHSFTPKMQQDVIAFFME